MLTVILTILKIIGITLAVLIGLVLLIVLLVGFVPIRYKADAKYPAEAEMNEEVISRRKRDALMNKVRASTDEEDNYGEEKKGIPVRANVVVSWLLHFVHVSVNFDSNGLIINAKLLGLFKLYSNDPEYVKKKEEKRKQKEEKARQKAEKEKEKKKDEKSDTESEIEDEVKEDEIKSITDGSEKTAVNETEDNKETETTEKTAEEKDSDKKEPDKKEDKEKEENTDEDTEDEDDDDSWWFDDDEEPEPEEQGEKGILGKIKSIPSKIKAKIKGIRDKIKNIKHKIRKLNKKKNYILDMKDDPRVISGVNYGKDKLFLIIKRCLPKKLKGRVAFGMDDPATTGYITGAASMFFPIWGPHFDFEPDFENKKIEADVDLKGRIILALLVIPAVKVWFNKDIKYIRKKVRGFKKL